MNHFLCLIFFSFVQSKKKNVKGKRKGEKEKDMDNLKQELELDEHKVPIEELFQRLSVNPDTVRLGGSLAAKAFILSIA